MSKYITVEEFNDKNFELQKQITRLHENLNQIANEERLMNLSARNTLDEHKYRLTQKTPWGEIDHYFHEDREEQLIKLIRYCNEKNINYELNEKAKEFHNKLYNLILKGE